MIVGESRVFDETVLKNVAEALLLDIIPELLSIAIKTREPLRSVLVSVSTGGLGDMHSLVHEAFCTCGDPT